MGRVAYASPAIPASGLTCGKGGKRGPLILCRLLQPTRHPELVSGPVSRLGAEVSSARDLAAPPRSPACVQGDRAMGPETSSGCLATRGEVQLGRDSPGKRA